MELTKKQKKQDRLRRIRESRLREKSNLPKDIRDKNSPTPKMPRKLAGWKVSKQIQDEAKHRTRAEALKRHRLIKHGGKV